MKRIKNLTGEIKNLYLQGKNKSEIATILGISRVTVDNHKAKDEAKTGISWDELELSKARSENSIKSNEARMLNLLIKSFDKFFEKLEVSEAVDIDDLEHIFKFAKIYRSILDSKRFDEKALMLETARVTVEKIAELATKSKNEAVAKFLADFSDEIYAIVLNANKEL